MTSITPITTILQEMRFAAAQAEQARGKSVVVFLGNTGSGKSTTINYLAGLPMYYGTGGIDVSPPREPIAPIGHGTISRARFTSVYPIEEEVVEEGAARRKWHFVDTGGFLDTR